jgi:hypothetical protein
LKSAKRTEVFVTDADIRKWLPGDSLYDGAIALPADLPSGDYEVSIGIVDGRTRTPRVKLAIKGIDGEGWHPLMTIRIEAPPPD